MVIVCVPVASPVKIAVTETGASLVPDTAPNNVPPELGGLPEVPGAGLPSTRIWNAQPPMPEVVVCTCDSHTTWIVVVADTFPNDPTVTSCLKAPGELS